MHSLPRLSPDINNIYIIQFIKYFIKKINIVFIASINFIYISKKTISILNKINKIIFRTDKYALIDFNFINYPVLFFSFIYFSIFKDDDKSNKEFLTSLLFMQGWRWVWG